MTASRNGLQRLGSTFKHGRAGVIAHYVMDGDQPLTADSAGNTTFYLYGLGAIGEKTTAWGYSLPDGTNTPRQPSNLTGGITLSARYTPCPLRFTLGVLTCTARRRKCRKGDTLDTYGTGNFAFGYFGRVTLAPPATTVPAAKRSGRAGVDAATGLLYVGNGQYGVYPELPG